MMLRSIDTVQAIMPIQHLPDSGGCNLTFATLLPENKYQCLKHFVYISNIACP